MQQTLIAGGEIRRNTSVFLQEIANQKHLRDPVDPEVRGPIDNLPLTIWYCEGHGVVWYLTNVASVLAQFEQLKDLLAQLEEGALEHPVDSVAAVLEALEAAALIEMYESEATSLLLQASANLMERIKDQELSPPELHQLIQKLQEVGYTDPEIRQLLALDALELDPP